MVEGENTERRTVQFEVERQGGAYGSERRKASTEFRPASLVSDIVHEHGGVFVQRGQRRGLTGDVGEPLHHVEHIWVGGGLECVAGVARATADGNEIDPPDRLGGGVLGRTGWLCGGVGVWGVRVRRSPVVSGGGPGRIGGAGDDPAPGPVWRRW